MYSTIKNKNRLWYTLLENAHATYVPKANVKEDINDAQQCLPRAQGIEGVIPDDWCFCVSFPHQL
jgi:hypothetical protein